MILRVIVGLLLAANLLLWAWGQRWLAPIGLGPAVEREPQRLAQQVQPESVRVLSPEAASAALASLAQRNALPCFEAGPFTSATIDAAEQALAGVLPERGWIRVTRESGTDIRLRVENATPAVADQLRALPAGGALGAGFVLCPR